MRWRRHDDDHDARLVLNVAITVVTQSYLHHFNINIVILVIAIVCDSIIKTVVVMIAITAQLFVNQIWLCFFTPI